MSVLVRKQLQLTVVTEGRGGTTNLYSFMINYGDGSPKYTTVRVNDAPAIASQIPPTDTSKSHSVVTTTPLLSKSNKSPIVFDIEQTKLNSFHISLGLSRHCWNGLIPLSSWDYGKAKNFLALISAGFSTDDALRQSTISTDSLIKLSEIGSKCQSLNNS